MILIQSTFTFTRPQSVVVANEWRMSHRWCEVQRVSYQHLAIKVAEGKDIVGIDRALALGVASLFWSLSPASYLRPLGVTNTWQKQLGCYEVSEVNMSNIPLWCCGWRFIVTNKLPIMRLHDDINSWASLAFIKNSYSYYKIPILSWRRAYLHLVLFMLLEHLWREEKGRREKKGEEKEGGSKEEKREKRRKSREDRRKSWPLGGILLERVEDLAVVAELTDEAFLSTQTAAVHVGTGKLDHFGEEGSQFPIYHLYRGWRAKKKKKGVTEHGIDKWKNKPEVGPKSCHSRNKTTSRIRSWRWWCIHQKQKTTLLEIPVVMCDYMDF